MGQQSSFPGITWLCFFCLLSFLPFLPGPLEWGVKNALRDPAGQRSSQGPFTFSQDKTGSPEETGRGCLRRGDVTLVFMRINQESLKIWETVWAWLPFQAAAPPWCLSGVGGCRQVASRVWVRFLAYTACLPAGTGTRGVGSGTFPLNYPLKRYRIKLFIKS